MARNDAVCMQPSMLWCLGEHLMLLYHATLKQLRATIQTMVKLLAQANEVETAVVDNSQYLMKLTPSMKS